MKPYAKTLMGLMVPDVFFPIGNHQEPLAPDGFFPIGNHQEPMGTIRELALGFIGFFPNRTNRKFTIRTNGSYW